MTCSLLTPRRAPLLRTSHVSKSNGQNQPPFSTTGRNCDTLLLEAWCSLVLDFLLTLFPSCLSDLSFPNVLVQLSSLTGPLVAGNLWASVLGYHLYPLYCLPNQSYLSCGCNYPACPGSRSPHQPSHIHPLLPFGVPATLTHFQFLECAMHFSTSGPLHMIFVLHGTLNLLSPCPPFCF